MTHYIEPPVRRAEPSIRFVFTCECGCNRFHRAIEMKMCVSFFEGYFNCSACNRQHDYYSDAFTRVEQPTQLQLF